MKYLLLFLFYCVAGLIHAQTDTTHYPFVAYWGIGDTYNFRVSKIKLNYVNDSLVKADTTTYTSIFEVLDSTEEGYLIGYTFGNEYYSTETVSPEITAALTSFDLSSITYTTNAHGQFLALKNWKPFAHAMRAALDMGIAQTIAHQRVDTALFHEIMAPLISAYTTEQGIWNKLVGELQHFHLFYGYTYVNGDTLRYEDSFANMFGGAPFPVESKLHIERTDYANDYVVMRHYNTLTPAGQDIFKETLKQVYPSLLQRDPQGFEEISLDIQDDNWYAYYYYPGIPARIENDRWTTVTVSGKKTVNQERLIVDWID